MIEFVSECNQKLKIDPQGWVKFEIKRRIFIHLVVKLQNKQKENLMCQKNNI